MTQPIQEPTTQRSISRLVWGENQLFRRPGAPSGDLPSAFLELDKESLETTADEEGLSYGTLFTTNDASVFDWTTPDRFITPLQTGRYLTEVYVGIKSELIQWARAPTDAGVVGVGMCYFGPSSPTPNQLDQLYVNFSDFSTAMGSETYLNLTRHFLYDITELDPPDTVLQPLCWVTPDAVDIPSFGAAVFSRMRVTLLGPFTEN